MTTSVEPSHDCPLCPRLAAFREEQRAAHPDWHNAPVPGFGDHEAWLTIVGLAPGLQGANRSAMIIESAMPTAVINLILASEFGLPAPAVARIVVISTLISPLTIAATITILGL